MVVQRYFYPLRNRGLWEIIQYDLAKMAREAVGREATPSARIIDSQVKTMEAGGPHLDAGKNVKGRKHHFLTDSFGLLVAVVVNEASIQDRDSAPILLASIRHAFLGLQDIFADSAYAGKKLKQALWQAQPLQPRNCSPRRCRQTRRGLAETLDCRTHDRLSESKLPPCQRLLSYHHQCPRVNHDCKCQAAVAPLGPSRKSTRPTSQTQSLRFRISPMVIGPLINPRS